MKDKDKTKEQLISELAEMRQRITELQALETQHKQAEEQLRDSERHYRLLADNTNDIIWTMDKNLQLTYISPSIERHSGYTVEEMMEMTLEQTYTPASVEAMMKAYEEEVSLGKTGVKGQPTSRVLELEGYKKDGSTEWIEIHTTVLRDQDGNVTGIVGVTRKITERKKAEEKLRIRDKAIESSINAVAMANLEGNLTYLNPSFLKLWGYDNEEEILGRPTVEFWQAEEEAAMVMRAVLEKGGWQGELVAKRKDGLVFNVELSASLVRDEYGKPVCMMGCFIDLTERKRAEAELQHHYEQERELRQNLEEEVKRRVEFTRALVHELKTPVTPILASSDLLVEQLQEGPSLSLAKNIKEGASTMNRRIDTLLDLARGELGMLQLNRKQVDPLQLLQKVASEMSPAASSRELSLVLDVPRSLPSVWVDGSRLQQVIVNLLTNAFKWSPQGGKVTLRAKQKNDALIVEVQDMGPGIAKENQQKIFDAYYRVESDRQRLDGLGLGLALCKTIVESHGGKIWVESEKGKGSTFGFSVPLHVDVD
ncbi:MAG TPA: PAS domain-containing sensor histidine kinase [Dehalococcoidia bacterium]|nr:PAS domain-containing sensor histidine kinase [Dehalococcoidia bacterium]